MENRKITLENGMEITGATLLTVKEAERLPEETRAIGCWWWLRSPGCWWWLRSPGRNSSTAAFVDSGGSVDYYGYDVSYDNGAVRPALIVNLKSSNLQIGDRFRFEEKEFEIISDTRALCTESVGKHAFRDDWQVENANDYETSDVKKFVDDWYQDAVNMYSKQKQNDSKNEIWTTGLTVKNDKDYGWTAECEWCCGGVENGAMEGTIATHYYESSLQKAIDYVLAFMERMGVKRSDEVDHLKDTLGFVLFYEDEEIEEELAEEIRDEAKKRGWKCYL